MSAWVAWSEEWLLRAKVDFDGTTRLIHVHPEVTDLSIRSDVYSAWVNWVALYDNLKFAPAIRYSGLDPIPGGQTGDSYFLMNGWRLIIDLTKVRVVGVLYSENFETAFYDSNLKPQHPATVASLVMSSVTKENVVTGNISDITVPTAQEIATTVAQTLPGSAEVANAVWAHSWTAKLLTIAKYLGLK